VARATSYFENVLFGFDFDPKFRLFHLFALLQEKSNAISSILQAIEDHDFEILHFASSLSKDKSQRQISVLMRVLNNDIRSSDLKKKIDSMPLTVQSIINESSNGFLSDSIHFPIRFTNGRRTILLGGDTFGDLISVIQQTFSSGGSVILFKEGFSIGSHRGRGFLNMLGEKFVRDNFKLVYSAVNVFGWGRFELIDFGTNPPRATIRVLDNVECLGRKSDHPYSHFVRGHQCGFVSTLMNTELSSREVACVAMGADHCEFVLEQEPSKSLKL
jgi:predicted hydrocarbon binding protein